MVRGDPALSVCRGNYRRLLNDGFSARYTPGFRILEATARELIDVDLEAVRSTVQGALAPT